MTLKNKTILIVGAGGLLGANVVKASQRLGAKIVAADICIKTLSEKLLQSDVELEQVAFESLDITDTESVASLFAKYDCLDGAVNCTYPRNKSYGAHFFDVELESFNENLALHLGSAFLFTQQCAKYFKEHEKPFSLINISSIYGVIAPKFEVYDNTTMTMPVEYAAIKSAILHMSKYTVKYVNDSRFRINSVSPGGIFDNQPDSFLSAYKKNTHGEGMLNVDDVLGAVVFLLSDDSKFITGQNIVVDDGFSL
ncbi:oxidoreductase [Pseudoalteromonas sp. 1_2015MBL_MicDiv]|uniref:oxidoreductase n=1 Tax=Pseudoalteromonas sp. 1_2015MBL_MicDiv TaxID=1720343 RepID=UPI000BBE2128|nr:oxidoreductase [Pseudoalteromonas sp. 1_2015MBL_MicDiv]ATG76499.1 flagellin modification protein A [Pseudoalteromonas sp. 1_2015MBL_MicDiv]